MKASKKPVVKFRLDITADGMPHPNEQFGPVDRESDHGESEHGENDHGESVSPFALDWRSSSVYLWSLIARDSAKKLSEESTDCSVDFEVLGDRIGAASLKFSSPYRNDQWPDQFLQAVAKGSASKPKLDHILDLVFRDLVSDPPPRGFMLLLDQLQSIIDPDHMTL
ncbi:hypothetical protein GNI_159700 [Gregarina niphandrodes]|uniref:Uncharacterized protein n=1 Tax=Gregarina niphandrodes TaxID=110365 RepID=A0A023AZ51_GRENI|nr:hypothetical protein GNI_159700 [Gregarina niphandrodes]EZG43773.1 hypothetical protein GNI_159700 [Gregarina niphandrodes]|eukprot:XP_011134621.1 hypothetical protein GNI_159700 [Gregarina niphandrodes]